MKWKVNRIAFTFRSEKKSTTIAIALKVRRAITIERELKKRSKERKLKMKQKRLRDKIDLGAIGKNPILKKYFAFWVHQYIFRQDILNKKIQ